MIVLFTGGGTAGHILPNVPLIERLAAEGHSVHYAGSGVAMERDLLAALPLTYHVLPTGKLRRYFSLQNVRDAWRVLQGIVAGVLLVRRLRPDVVFSKGGFVSVPAVLGAWL
jgi:UDP-N-acetylglucosamine--N-acetylmuramyl-(pentapeptide) pyrophosphoryl-undecaprenol N-acetylglucosamine transferase